MPDSRLCLHLLAFAPAPLSVNYGPTRNSLASYAQWIQPSSAAGGGCFLRVKWMPEARFGLHSNAFGPAPLTQPTGVMPRSTVALLMVLALLACQPSEAWPRLRQID